MGCGEFFNSGRHLLRAVLVGVTQPAPLSNFPAAGAVPPVFPSIAQSPRETMPTPNQAEPGACWKDSQTPHPSCLCGTLGILSYQERQREKKGEHTPVAQAQLWD